MQAGNTQIRQMVNFILQEAHEKANEIRIKTEHDFNIEKQMLVHNAKLAIAEDYKAKDRARDVEERIARSTAVGDARITKMRLRDELLTSLVEDAKTKTAAVVSSANYKKLLHGLIIQALIKIEEDVVVVLCRAADVSIVSSVIAKASAEYKELIKTTTGQVVSPQVTVNTNPAKNLNPEFYSGGVVLTACHGRIVCDNTLDARVRLVYQDLLPKIRERLWVDAKK